MHILLTRPESDSIKLARELRAAGHVVTIEPLLEVTFHNQPIPDISGAQALVFTSANGVRAFARLSEDRSLAVVTVGATTAQAARDQGFTQVTAAGGNVESLGDMLAEAFNPTQGRLVHIAGSAIAGNLKGRLESLGFDVTREILYETTAATSLSDSLIGQIKAQEIDLMLFFSPRTAQTFANLSHKHRIETFLSHSTAGCLSFAVKDALHSLPWHRIVVGKRATQDALLEAAGLIF